MKERAIRWLRESWPELPGYVLFGVFAAVAIGSVVLAIVVSV